jgi:hypothetical protein
VLNVLKPPQSPVVRKKRVRGEIFDLLANANVIAITIAAEILASKVPKGSEKFPCLNGRPMIYRSTDPMPPPTKMRASVIPFIV